MWNWILIVSLYLLGMGLLGVLGGLGSAGDAIRNWGESASGRERSPSPCS
jgi:hypothetical protein